MEAAFNEELRLLANALRSETFRFILIGHNRYSIYTDIAAWLRQQFPARTIQELRLRGKDYRHIVDELEAIRKGIILIPDFDWLLLPENESLRVAFNQRRDAFAQLDLALLCFVEPNLYRQIPKKLPDWWSIRSLELEFYRSAPETEFEFLQPQTEISSLGGQTRDEKLAEMERLLRQVELADKENKLLLQTLYEQLGRLAYDLSEYDEALIYWRRCLQISQEVGDRKGEGIILNNISQIYAVRDDFDIALKLLQESLYIRREIGDRSGEGINLNNISLIYMAQDNYEIALGYLQQSLKISQESGDRRGEGATLNNISKIYMARYDYDTALEYLQQSLGIRQEIDDRKGEGITRSNISLIYHNRGDHQLALVYLQQSLHIQQKIGDRSGLATTLHNMGIIYFEQFQNIEQAIRLFWSAYQTFTQLGLPRAEITAQYLNEIKDQIGEARFNEIVQAIEQQPE